MDNSDNTIETKNLPESQSILQLNFGKFRKFSKKHNFLLFSLCIFVASYYIAPNERVFKSIFYYLVFVLFVVSIDREVFTQVKRSLIFRYSLIWLGYLAVTVIWSDLFAIKHVESVVRGFLWIGAFLIILITLSRQEQIFPKYLFVLVAIVSSATAAVAILQFSLTYEVHGRLTGFGQLGRHALAAAVFYGAAVLMTAFGLVASAQTVRARILYCVMLAVLLTALVLTASRGPLFGVALAVLVGLVAARRWTLALTIAGSGVAVVAATAALDAGPYDFVARGTAYRLEIWSNVVDGIQEAFWFGHGIAASLPATVVPDGQRFQSAHQMFLANHFYGGVPATLFLLMVLGAAARTAYRLSRSGGSFVYAALLIFMLVVSMTYIDRVIKSANDVWFFVWLPLGLLAGQEALMNEKASRANRCYGSRE